MFHCTDCGISFPSAALLSNHKQRFCISSRVDLQTQRLLQGDGFTPTPAPGGGAQHHIPSQNYGRWDAPTGQPYTKRQLTPPGNNNNNNNFLPPINQGRFSGGGRNSTSSTTHGGQLMMADPGPRSYSAEPYLPGDHNNFKQYPSPSSQGMAMNNGGGGGWGPTGPYSGGQGPSLANGAQYYMGSEIYRVLEQQQRQIQQLTSALSQQGVGHHDNSRGPYGAPQGQHHQQPTLPQQPHFLPSLSTPSQAQNILGNGGVIEGRYGLRIFAAEGLLAFHTITDHSPVSIAVRQFYCRRRLGQYLPELEQRDEWEFTTRRTVAAKRRDGYVNFGRAEYIFNVVTATEIVLVIEVLSKGRLVAWSEVLLDSLGDKVRRLRHPPVDIAGALRDLTLRSTTATIGIELFRARWDMFGFDGRDEQEESIPPPREPKPRKQTPPPPKETKPPTPPPAEKVEEYCHFYVDKVSGVPFNILCSRVMVHVSTEANNMGEPVCTSYQDPNSACAEPRFVADADCKLTESSCVVVVIEGIETKKQARVTLGHCAIPVRIGAAKGNFICRVRRGEPNRQQLIPYQDDVKDNLPCMQMHYRLDSTDLQKTYAALRMPLSEDEKQVERERANMPIETPAGQDVNEPEMAKFFREPVFRGLFDTSFLAPYSSARGLFVHVEQLKQINKDAAKAPALHKVAVRINNKTYWTKNHDMNADISCPKFTDGPFRWTGIDFDPHTCAFFYIYRIAGGSGTTSLNAKIEQVAWGCAKLFLVPNALRNGRFMIPLFQGSPPEKFLQELQNNPIEGVMMDWVNRSKEKLEYYDYSMLSFAQGDPLRQAEQLEVYDTKPQAKVILVPERVKEKFPLLDTQGLAKYKTSRAVPDGGNADSYVGVINGRMIAQYPELA